MASVEAASSQRAGPGEQAALRGKGETSVRRARERRRSLLRGVRRGLLALALAAATVGTLFALRPRPVPIDAARVVRGPLAVTIEESGMTRVKDRYLVSAPVAGNVARQALEPGDSVKEGDVLAEIAPAVSPLIDERSRAEAEARLGAARAALGQAQAQRARASSAKQLAEQDLSRLRQLEASGAIAHEALEQAEFEARMRGEELASSEFSVKVATEQVRVAGVALDRGVGRSGVHHHVNVLAPASGHVLRVQQKSAGVVPAGAPLVEVGDPAGLEIVVDLLTTDAVRVKSGTGVVIEGWGGDEPLAGRVRRVEPSAFTRPSALGIDEQRVNVIVALTSPREKWSSFGDGYRVETRLVLWQSERVLKVPLGAVFRYGKGWAAFRIDDGIAKLVPVTVGHRSESEVEIVSGLALGAEVAVHPGDRVKDGARVAVR